MDWDTRTQTGARTSGVEEPQLLEWRCITESIVPTQSGAQDEATGARRADANLRVAQGMLGAGLTWRHGGKRYLKGQPSSRTGENPRTVDRGIMEPTASLEVRFARWSYPTDEVA